MTRVTEFEVVDDHGSHVTADPQGNNVAFACLQCDGPVLAIALPGQRGSSEANPSECPVCGHLMWVQVEESKKHMILRSATSSRVLLHDEIVEILAENGRPMTTQEVADIVNRRARYVKKDGSLVTAYQIHGRTRKYDKVFARDGQRIGLLRWALEVE